jgi:hypothetical protein
MLRQATTDARRDSDPFNPYHQLNFGEGKMRPDL